MIKMNKKSNINLGGGVAAILTRSSVVILLLHHAATSTTMVSATHRPSQRTDLVDAVETDSAWGYWNAPLEALDAVCGGDKIKTGDGGAFTCLTVGESICRDNSPGSFGPGLWTLGIADGTLKLFTPKNEVAWEACSDVTHVCIGEDHGYKKDKYSEQRPYLFFYDEKTHSYVGELTCDDTDGEDGRNIDTPSILKMVDVSDLGPYVDYNEGVGVTKYKKGQTEDPFDFNALFELVVFEDALAEGFYDNYKCEWKQICRNCGDELYEEFNFTLDFDLFEFCAVKIPLSEDVKMAIEKVLLQFLNQDAQCADKAEGIIGCVDEIYDEIDIIFFENSEETCTTTNGTNTLRRLFDEEKGRQLNRRRRRSRRSRGRARGRGRCRRCKRRRRNSRKRMLQIEPTSHEEDKHIADGTNHAKNTAANTFLEQGRTLQEVQVVDGQLACPPDLAKLFRMENETLFGNVTEAEVFNFTYLDPDEVVEPDDCDVSDFAGLVSAVSAADCPDIAQIEICPGTILFQDNIDENNRCFDMSCPQGSCTFDLDEKYSIEFNNFNISFNGITFLDGLANRPQSRKKLPEEHEEPEETPDWKLRGESTGRKLQSTKSVSKSSGTLPDEEGGCLALRGTSPNSDCSITNCTFSGCTADDRGGAVYAEDGVNLQIESSIFRNCRSGDGGGAVCARTNGAVYINECTFQGNTAVDGGGVYLTSEEDGSTILNSVFTDNTAVQLGTLFPGSGGAIYLIAKSSFDKIMFDNNTATDFGGAIYAEDFGDLKISSCNFRNCASGKDGGAICARNKEKADNNITIELSDFERNTAKPDESRDGGAIYINTAFAHINLCEFLYNAAEEGGALYTNSDSTVIQQCNFTGNSAENDGHGGAVFVDNGSKECAILNAVFDSNSAENDGGAIFQYQDISVSYSVFKNNSAGDDGGALYDQGYDASIEFSDFESNTAEYGGAISTTGLLKTNDCTFQNNGNTFTVFGGAIFNEAADANFTECSFQDNTATEGGGAIYSEHNNAPIKIIKSNFTGNSVVDYAGAIYTFGPAEINKCNFKNNVAEDGGALYIDYEAHNSSIVNTTFTNNEAFSGSGGALFVFDVSTEINDCIFRGNTATGNIISDDGAGGAVYFPFSNGSFVVNTVFDNNTASNWGGALYFEDLDLFTIDDSVFKENQAGEGGAIYIEDSNGSIKDSTFYNNTADGLFSADDSSGDDIHVTDSGTIDCGFSDNRFCNAIGQFSNVSSNVPKSTCAGASTGDGNGCFE